MEISKHIIDEALEIIQNNPNSLPARITSAPLFLVALEDDPTVHAFHAIKHDEVMYIIGPKRSD